MGMQHIKFITKSKKATLHSLVDINKNLLSLLNNKYKVPVFYNIKKLLAENRPDAVIISTPNKLHKKQCVSFLKNKIPVLLEKPISDNIKSAIKIIKSSENNNTPLLIGYHRRHNSIVSVIKKKIDSGKLGKIVSANVYVGFTNIKNITNKNGELKKEEVHWV